jgi:GNAT superfamily N-acetyltransferase
MSAAPTQPEFVSASVVSLEAFAALYSQSFADYFYPMTQTVEGLAARIRAEHLDLYHSVVMQIAGEAVGQVTLGLRARDGWCGGFGILPRWRGAGLAAPLFAAFVTRARMAGATRLTLEVLTRNTRALKVYTGAGMRVTRDLLLIEWSRPQQSHERTARSDAAVWAVDDVAPLLAHHARLQTTPPCWSRDLSSLQVLRGLRALGVGAPEHPAAYVLYAASSAVAGAKASIYGLAATRESDAMALLQALQSRFAMLTSVNEPDDSPLTPVFFAAGFRETDRQHELTMAL